MNINITALAQIFNNLVENLKENGQHEIELENIQYYWTVHSNDMCDFDSENIEPGVGDIDDDIAELSKLLSGGTPSTLDIERLGDVLKVLSNHVSI